MPEKLTVLGVKAGELISLAQVAPALGYQVPEFEIVGPMHLNISPIPGPVPVIPPGPDALVSIVTTDRADDIGSDVLAAHRRVSASDLSWVRSSAVTEGAVSCAGINCTTRMGYNESRNPGAVVGAIAASYGRASVGNYFDALGASFPTTAYLIVSSDVEVVADGVVTWFGGEFCVDFRVQPSNVWRCSRRSRLNAIGRMMAEVGEGLCLRFAEHVDAPFEVEFSVGRDSRVVLHQCRRFPKRPPFTGMGPHGSITVFDGRVVDLRSCAREDVLGIVGLLTDAPTILMVNSTAPRTVDLFSLLWAVQRTPSIASPIRVAMVGRHVRRHDIVASLESGLIETLVPAPSGLVGGRSAQIVCDGFGSVVLHG